MEKSKDKLFLGQYKSIKEQAKDIQKKLSYINGKRIEVSTIEYGYTARGTLNSMESTAESEIEVVIKSYNDSKAETEKILGIKLAEIEYGSNEPEALLHQLVIECDKVIYYLESLESNLSSQESDKLNNIRKELNEVCEKMDINFEKNLEKAIIEAEFGHSLACALTTSRVIEVILDKFEGNKIEEKLEYLISEGLIDKSRQDVKESIIRASKRSRDFLSHRIDIFPETSDSLSLLGDAVNLLRIYKKLI